MILSFEIEYDYALVLFCAGTKDRLKFGASTTEAGSGDYSRTPARIYE